MAKATQVVIRKADTSTPGGYIYRFKHEYAWNMVKKSSEWEYVRHADGTVRQGEYGLDPAADKHTTVMAPQRPTFIPPEYEKMNKDIATHKATADESSNAAGDPIEETPSSSPGDTADKLRDSSEAEQESHNLQAAGSIPAPATKKKKKA
jgi:hypothetical protein